MIIDGPIAATQINKPFLKQSLADTATETGFGVVLAARRRRTLLKPVPLHGDRRRVPWTVSGADLENELAQLPEMARRQALELDLPAEAEKELQQQLNKRIHARQPVRLVFTTPSLIESPVANP